MVYVCLLLFILVAFYVYIGPVIWIVGAVFLGISLLSTHKDMMVSFQLTLMLILIFVVWRKPTFEISGVYYVALFICLSVLLISNYASHSILTDRMLRLKQQYEQKELAEKQFYFTLSSIGDAVITTDRLGYITFMNLIAEQMTGYGAVEAMGKKIQDILILYDEMSHEPIPNPIDTVLVQQNTIQRTNHTLLFTKDGREIAVEDTASPIFDASKKVVGVVIIIRDCSFKKEKQQEIEYLSYHDQLSGLYNRKYYEKELEKLKRNSALPLSVLYIDINGLKLINNALGHEKGDAFIQRISNILSKNSRPQDIIARVGGDEFVILMPNTEQLYIKHYMKEITHDTTSINMMGIEVPLSFGWEIQYSLNQNIADILKAAEDKMYQNKIYYTASKQNDVIKSILTTLALKSKREGEHSNRVRHLCYRFGKALSLSESACKLLEISGELHDIGKIAIDETLLNKKDDLTQTEWELIRKHPETGYKLLNVFKEFSVIAEYVYAHHEHWDGSGYPRGLKGIDIPLNARIISIVDAYDAMRQDFPFRKKLSRAAVIEELNRKSNKQFDPELVRVFIEYVLEVEKDRV
jgi:diguanylate cyclase (GGDEF)-like protein/PAS domain S-box-containing protein